MNTISQSVGSILTLFKFPESFCHGPPHVIKNSSLVDQPTKLLEEHVRGNSTLVNPSTGLLHDTEYAQDGMIHTLAFI